jgi:hypothetical protein
MFRFTIRDVLWLTAVIALVVVWRTDVARQEADWRAEVARQEADYLNKLVEREGDYYSPDRRFVLHVAKNHPELLVELNAFDADNKKNLSQRPSLILRFNNLVDKATDLYRRDTGKAPYKFFEEEPFEPQSK